MALQASDVFIVQQSTGAEALAKVTAYELTEFIESTGGLHYKGIADFTEASEEPAGPLIGDLWLNNASANGAFAWTADPATPGEIAVPTSRAVWNGSYWDLISGEPDEQYVTAVTGTLPIQVTLPGLLTEPNVSIDDATTTAPGAVQLASSADLAAGSTTSVVTADQLASVISDVDAIQLEIDTLGPGTVTQVLSAAPGDPITITDSTTTPTIAIKDATTTDKGVVTLASADDILNKTANKVVTADQMPDPITEIDGGVYATDGIVGEIWSNYCTGPASDPYTYDKAFDGVTNTEPNRCIPDSGEVVSFIPPNQLDGNVSLWISISTDSLPANTVTVNGTDYTALANAAYAGSTDTPVLVSIPESSINNTEGITWANTGFFTGLIGLAGVVVGGTLLIDGA